MEKNFDFMTQTNLPNETLNQFDYFLFIKGPNPRINRIFLALVKNEEASFEYEDHRGDRIKHLIQTFGYICDYGTFLSSYGETSGLFIDGENIQPEDLSKISKMLTDASKEIDKYPKENFNKEPELNYN